MRVGMVGRGRVFGVVAAALLATTDAALADPPPEFPPCNREPSQADVDGAAGSHRAAKAYYERGEYDRAVQLWRDAYNFDCTKPAVFLNMANAYEKKGDKVAAIAMLETYLVRAKDAPDKGTIEAKINNLKSSIKPQETGPATPPPADTAAPPPGPVPTATVGPDKPVPATGERPFGVIPWIVAGVGAAAVVGGVIPLVIGFGRISDAERLCGEDHKSCPKRNEQTDEDKQIIADGETGQDLVTIGWIIGVGAAALVGGLVWQFAFNSPRAPATTGQATVRGPRITPVVGPRQNGLLLTGQF